MCRIEHQVNAHTKNIFQSFLAIFSTLRTKLYFEKPSLIQAYCPILILKKNDDEFQRIHASKLIDHLSAILYCKANDFHQTDNEIFI